MTCELDTLRRNWGGAYEIGTDDSGRPRARRLDGIGDWIVTNTVDELTTRIVDDYTSRPGMTGGDRS